MDEFVGGRAVEAAQEEEGDVGDARPVAEERLDAHAEALFPRFAVVGHAGRVRVQLGERVVGECAAQLPPHRLSIKRRIALFGGEILS